MSIVVDDSLWPIVIATWFGEPSEALVEKYFAHHATLLERARGWGERIVLVTDTFATERPSPRARKRIVELTEAQPKDTLELTVKSYIVIESAIMRGVVTALSWVYPKMAESENVASLAIAIERASTDLRALGITPPRVSLEGHARPKRPGA